MALAYNIVKKMPNQRQTVVDITLDTAYPANGYTLTNASMGVLSTPDIVVADVSTTEAIVPQWIKATNKLKFLKTGAGLSGVLAEIASTDVTASTIVRAEVTGDVAI